MAILRGLRDRSIDRSPHLKILRESRVQTRQLFQEISLPVSHFAMFGDGPVSGTSCALSISGTKMSEVCDSKARWFTQTASRPRMRVQLDIGTPAK